MLEILTLTVGVMATNCYIVFDPKGAECAIVDPGDDAEYISETLLRTGVTPTVILATHGHFDHILAAFALQNAFGIPFRIHEKDMFLVVRMQESAKHFLRLPHVDPNPEVRSFLTDGELIPVGSGGLVTFHTPGHTPGSVIFEVKGMQTILVGDTVFADGAVGRTDHSYSSRGDLQSSIRRILSYPKETAIRAGHGEATSVGRESGFHVQ